MQSVDVCGPLPLKLIPRTSKSLPCQHTIRETFIIRVWGGLLGDGMNPSGLGTTVEVLGPRASPLLGDPKTLNSSKPLTLYNPL